MDASDRKNKLEFSKYPLIAFVFVFVRGPLFRIEDLKTLGLKPTYVWRTVKSLVRAGVLEKYDRKSYGVTEEARNWFRIAFGGGVNDAAFTYSALIMESWGKSRLEFFKSRLSEMWEQRPDRIKMDANRTSFVSYNEDFSSLIGVLCEKMEEASFVLSLLQKSTMNKK